MKKKTEVKQLEKEPEPAKEVPKLKKVEKIKADSPAPRSRSQSPIPDLKRVQRQPRAESPLRAQSPIPKLKAVPKKGSPAPEKVRIGKSLPQNKN